MSGPTRTKPVISFAESPAVREPAQDNQVYHVLLVITDSILNDIDYVLDRLTSISHLRLTVVFAGVGPADLTLMECFSQDSTGFVGPKNRTTSLNRKHTHFVSFSRENGQTIDLDRLCSPPTGGCHVIFPILCRADRIVVLRRMQMDPFRAATTAVRILLKKRSWPAFDRWQPSEERLQCWQSADQKPFIRQTYERPCVVPLSIDINCIFMSPTLALNQAVSTGYFTGVEGTNDQHNNVRAEIAYHPQIVT
ncbi:BON1-like protein [Mya arenaria]|uniref:BON1-like protein n=1 Tax=Mya arenaria TaxID=6604 RepID=A0ABY7ECP2_MYAAR|nr:BON1-like protein [Mya arenaria]